MGDDLDEQRSLRHLPPRLQRGVGKIAKGRHTRVTGTVGDVYLTVADEIVQAGIGKFPTASRKVGELLA